MAMKVIYGIKSIFLFFSWILLFKSNSVENSEVFLTSIMIYSGAIIFDLIFFVIEAETRVSNRLKGAYYGSIVLAIANGFITAIAFFGALGIITIEYSEVENVYQLTIQRGTMTDIFKIFLSIKVKLWIYMILVALFGVLEIFPGLLIAKENSQKID